VLLSDRDLIAELKAGQLMLEPFEPSLVQPSSIDVRLDRLFRVFNNHLYTHIDPAERQDDLTTMVDVPEGESFVLHPGEFVLASTLEVITLGQGLAARLEGKSSLGRLGLMTHSTAGLHRPRLLRPCNAGTVQYGHTAGAVVAGHESGTAVRLPAQLAGRTPLWLQHLRLSLSGAARPHGLEVLAELASLADRLISQNPSSKDPSL
jgi:hypothetical protein